VGKPDGWTVPADFCFVAEKCYKPQDKDSTGCGICTPGTDKYAFTPLANKCLIGKNCYDDQGKDSTGCLICAYATNPAAWSPVGATKITYYGFEDGQATGWTIANSLTTVGWNVNTKRGAGGKYSLWYGDPAAGDYDGGGQNSGKATTPEITLGAAGAKAGCASGCSWTPRPARNYDMLTIDVVEGTTATTIWQKNVTDQITMSEWQEIKIDLAAYAGKKVKFVFSFDTVDGVSNSGEGAYLDDIAIYADCP